MTKKTIFIIPGFKHTPKQKAYKAIAKLLKKEGYYPIVVSVDWKNTTISENTISFLKTYKKLRREEKYILGFSFGAMIAMLAATKVKVSGLMLCSLSPYFQEDLKDMPSLIASLGTNRYEDFTRLHAARLARKVKSRKTLFLYGDKETQPLIKRVNETYALIPSTQKYLFPIQKLEHDIAHPRYLTSIQHATKQLN